MTKSEAEEIDGICTACGEHTNLAETCCGVGIYFEGGVLSPEMIDEDEE